MKHRLIQLLNPDRREFGVLALWIVIAVLGGMLLCKSLLVKMLREDAQNTSNAWVSMLLARNPDILLLFAGDAPTVQTRHLLDEASHIGGIYRFRILGESGHLIFQSERMPSAGEHNSEKQVAKAFESGSVISDVHTGKPPQDVAYFVESFIPVKQNGAVVGVFDVSLDQSDNQYFYKQFLFLTEIILGTLTLFAGGLPGYRLYRQMRKLRDSRAETLYLAEHDSLTGIPNRDRMNDFAKRAMALHRQSKRRIAALMIDLYRFKDVNDEFGHAIGDKVLIEVANRLRSAVREGDLVARFGGDEFVVLQVGLYQPQGAGFLAEQLIRVLSDPYRIDGSVLNSGARIGIAISPPDTEDYDNLIASADYALYKAKEDGRNSVRFFEPGMDAKIRERRRIESDIERGLATDSFQLAFQPIHSFRDGTLLGFEALIRWPEGWPPQPPSSFIPVAEESGLINRLGIWALESACKTAAKWKKPLMVAVNLSPVQFRDGDIASIVGLALQNSGLNPARLELEVTESLWVQDTDSMLAQLNRLRKMGVRIALDDFGTGYSSLSYLWRFPFDTVKIDRSFVIDMENEPKAAAIAKTIAALGTVLDLTITAEGVETPEQARILKEAGCDQGQGFLFGRPLPVESANELANSASIARIPY